jgi:hypothetical protein
LSPASVDKLIYTIGILGAIAVFAVLAVVSRWWYQREIDPSKKFPNGRILVEFWSPIGPRRTLLCGIKANGYEIEPPESIQPKDKKSKQRYLFSPTAKTIVKYPIWMPFSFMQVDAPIVSICRDHSTAIDPELSYCPFCHEEIVIAEKALSAALQEQMRDTDTLEMGSELLDKAREQEKMLLAAVKNIPHKLVVYILLATASVFTLVGMIFAILAFKAANSI